MCPCTVIHIHPYIAPLYTRTQSDGPSTPACHWPRPACHGTQFASDSLLRAVPVSDRQCPGSCKHEMTLAHAPHAPRADSIALNSVGTPAACPGQWRVPIEAVVADARHTCTHTRPLRPSAAAMAVTAAADKTGVAALGAVVTETAGTGLLHGRPWMGAGMCSMCVGGGGGGGDGNGAASIRVWRASWSCDLSLCAQSTLAPCWGSRPPPVLHVKATPGLRWSKGEVIHSLPPALSDRLRSRGPCLSTPSWPCRGHAPPNGFVAARVWRLVVVVFVVANPSLAPAAGVSYRLVIGLWGEGFALQGTPTPIHLHPLTLTHSPP